MNPHFPIPLPDLSSNFRVTFAEEKPTNILPPEDLMPERDPCPLLGSPPLQTLARPGMNVVIAFTDATRPSPDRLLVGRLLQQLTEAGVRPQEITLLCAVGLHRPMSDAEFRAKLGEENMQGVHVVNHSATDRSGLIELDTIEGIPLTVNRRCVEADLLIATGIVEPHQYAGFSGGAKTVVIGCSGEETIQGTHGIEMLDKPGTRLGRIEENPFQRFVRQGGKRIGLRYVLNVVLNAEGKITAAACGRPDDVHDHLVARASQTCIATVNRPVQIALAGIPSAKCVNLYQASRGATYLAFADRTPLLPGAPIIIPASIPEGEGEGRGEQHFFQALSGAESPKELVERLRREGFPAGAQRAYILARVLAEHPVIVPGAEHPDVVRACHMEPTADLPSALARAEDIARRTFNIPAADKPDLLVVRNALTTLVRRSVLPYTGQC